MFEDVIPLIQQIANDRTVPRNIRSKCEESIKILQNNKEDLAVRINTVISYMDEVSNDPNIPMYTRTQVWNIVSILESKQK
jgi:uncharacterized protein (UPF0147 family)